jgi:hypothetical protein
MKDSVKSLTERDSIFAAAVVEMSLALLRDVDLLGVAVTQPDRHQRALPQQGCR